jgi:hypothetical protein
VHVLTFLLTGVHIDGTGLLQVSFPLPDEAEKMAWWYNPENFVSFAVNVTKTRKFKVTVTYFMCQWCGGE